MFHLLTGADPQDNPLLIFDFTKNPRPSQINPQITRRMEEIIVRSVEHKPEKRFRDAADMKSVLEEHLRFLDSQVMRVAANPGAPATTNAGQQVFCGNCGQRIAAEDLFCAHCGAKQLPAVNPNPLRATAKLIILGGTSPISFMLDKENHLIGRVDPHTGIFPEVDLSNYDPETKVSRRHARVYREGHQFLVEDLSSVNGTVVNGKFKLYPKQPHALQHGDELTLGETVLKFVLS
jgi:serine/threonine-protein kinase